jgi:Putative prokaryotic signal transducing protein
VDEPNVTGELVQVAAFLQPHEAKIARAQLEAENIPCFLNNERTLDIDWFLASIMGGYRLMVPAKFVERAREILESRISDEELAAQAEAAKPPAGDR